MDQILHICKYCGAPGVDYAEAQDGVASCRYCGNLNDLPVKQLPDEAVFALNDADSELFHCRFEEARESYTKVIGMLPNEPQAYFGRALAKFRVKYLKDERYSTEDKAKYQPICYGVTDKPFSKDPDYLKALALATDKQRDIYTAQAQEIDAIVSNFQALKAKGVDYDAFICCKVTDDNGGYTSDCTYAQRIYNDLQNKGFKPFFSEMDMGDFTGSEYEAVILYALYTSESMLIVCSNEDYLDTPWVKNEYSRFLSMTANGYKQPDSLTFVYSGKPIEKLPNGKKIQGIDRNAYGASEKIADFVRKHLPQSQQKGKFCANCGAEVPGNAKFCHECGNRKFFATHDEFVAAQAVAQTRKEQQAREEQLKKQQQEWEAQLQKQQAEREEQWRKQQQAREDQLAEMRRQMEQQRQTLQRQRQSYAQSVSDAALASREETIRRATEEAERQRREGKLQAAEAERTYFASPAADERASEPRSDAQAQPDDDSSQYLTFKLSRDGKSYSVAGFTGAPTSLTIPSRHKGLPVLSIKRMAFFHCESLTDVTISYGIRTVESFAFDWCENLKSVTISAGVQKIGDNVFSGCSDLSSLRVDEGNGVYYSRDDCIVEKATKTLVVGCKSSVIPADGSVTSIGVGAFYGAGLKTVSIPDTVTVIGDDAFSNCKELRSIVLPYSVVGIGKFAFSDSGLTTVAISDNVKYVGKNCFIYCDDLTKVTMPKRLAGLFGRNLKKIFGECAKAIQFDFTE